MSGDNEKTPDESPPPANEGRTVFMPSPIDGAPAQGGQAAGGDPAAPPPAQGDPAGSGWGEPPEQSASAGSGWGEPPEPEPTKRDDEGWGPLPDPSPGEHPAAPGAGPPGPTEGPGEQRTTWMPAPSNPPAGERWSNLEGRPIGPGSERDPGPTSIPGGLREPTAGPGLQTNFVPNAGARGIEIGDVLNHIFEVKRFIAAGGMGKVYEGINVNTEERVAIKVMLPQLAADPNVIGMFRKEARTLTNLRHEALVHYRVLAQEPQLGVLYIVTEYVDGTNLSDQLGRIQPSPAELTALLRRLASGLKAAHALNAIHRDISPDNVLLEGGKLAGAKVIDFGIAKNLDPGSATIVGDGFAGKLSYVAPEQLGDYGRNVGTWTDVYSLALVILAVAQGRNVQMGATLVDAVDKRRAGVDVSGAPESLRPVLSKMLKPNPIDRLQTMEDVLAELDRPADGAQAGKAATEKPRIPPLWLAGGVGALLVAIVGGWLLLPGDSEPDAGEASTPTVPSTVLDPAEAVRSALDSALPSVNCTWLSIIDVRAGSGAPTVSFTGVAGNPAQAQGQLGRALEAAGIQGASLDFEEVAPITSAGCAALDGFRTVRQPNPGGISVPQREFEMRIQGEKEAYEGQLAANPVVTLRTGRAEDFTVVGIEPSGLLDQEIPSRAFLDQYIVDNDGGPVERTADGYRLRVDSDHRGWTGLLLITGRPPFDAEIVAPPLGARGPDWLSKFATLAAEREWKTEMVWYKQVDEAPN